MPKYTVSDVRLDSIEPQTFVYDSTQTTLPELKTAIDNLMGRLMAAQQDGAVQVNGPLVFRYLGMTGDLTRPFTLEICLPVAAGTKPPRGLKLRTETEPFRALVVDFTGPVSVIDKAYDKLIPAIEAKKLTGTNEAREIYLNWEGPESEKNAIRVAMGIK